MALSRNVVRYGTAGLFITDAKSDGSIETENLESSIKFVNKLQSFNFSFDTARQDIKQIGGDDYVERKMIRNGNINLNFDYLLTDGYEENLLGLNIWAPTVKYNDDGEPYNVEVDNYGSVYNKLKDDKSLFFIVGEEGHDLTEYSKRELGLEGTSVLSIGNGYLTNYSISASVGDIARASVSFVASDFNFDCMSAGGGYYWYEITENFVNLISENNLENVDILFQDDGLVELEPELQYQRVGAIQNPSLNLEEKGTPLDKLGYPEVQFRPKLYKSAVSAIQPGAIKLKMPNLVIGGATLNEESSQNSCYVGKVNVQSFSIDLPFQREDLWGFESMHVYGRKMIFPQKGTFQVSLLASTFENGRMVDMFCGDHDHEIQIELTNECQHVCRENMTDYKTMIYKITNARLDNYNYSQTIDNIATVDCNFSFTMGMNQGLFISGTFNNNKDAISSCQNIPGDDRVILNI